LLTEGLILSAMGAAGGILLAYWCRDLLVLLFPSGGGIVAHLEGTVDARVLALTTGICLISTLLVGLFPAIQASRVDLASVLRTESGAVLGGHGKSRFRSTLVLIQLSLSFVLLVGAVLLIRSMDRLRNANPGFSTENVLTTGVDLLAAGYDAARAKNFQDELVNRVRSLGGVESAALARVRPFSYIPYSQAPIAVEGYRPGPDEQPVA